ncbi:MFS transporter [Streptomyces sp. NPDC093223]|uniref:MFS transporter n=1 Tax=Streptomyces sp. NPDC093223 TaxID=3366033 RepID=UPI00381977DC
MMIDRRFHIVALALTAAFMVFVDGTIVNLALAQLAARLGASRSELEWAINAYTLSFAAVMLVAGAITDALGARRTFLCGLSVFTAASAICASATTMPVLDIARLVQGAGSALLLPSALVLATASTADEAAHQKMLGWWAAAGGLGMAAGPLLGGVLVEVADWRAVFAVNVIVGIPALLWSIRSLPEPAARGSQRLDLVGMGCATALIGGLVFALVQAPAQGRLSPAVLTATALALLGLTGFVLAARGSRAPLLPPATYRDRGFATANVQGALFNFAFQGLLFAMSLMLQEGRGLGALVSGLMFLPLTGLIPVGSICAVPLARRLGRSTALAVGQVSLAITLLAVAWAGTSDSLWPLASALVPAGFSAGLLVPIMTSRALGAVRPALHGSASAVFNTSRQIGAAVGVAVFGPLLGSTGSVGTGFAVCVTVGAAATAVALLLTGLDRFAKVSRPVAG